MQYRIPFYGHEYPIQLPTVSTCLHAHELTTRSFQHLRTAYMNFVIIYYQVISINAELTCNRLMYVKTLLLPECLPERLQDLVMHEILLPLVDQGRCSPEGMPEFNTCLVVYPIQQSAINGCKPHRGPDRLLLLYV